MTGEVPQDTEQRVKTKFRKWNDDRELRRRLRSKMDATNNAIDEFLGFFAESIEDLSALRANPQFVTDMLSGKFTGSGCTRASDSQDHDEEGENGEGEGEPDEGESGGQEYGPQGEGRPATSR